MARHVFHVAGVLVSASLVAGAFVAMPTASAQRQPVGATAEVRDAARRLVAISEFREGRGEVLISIAFSNPPLLSGTHAVHIQEVGRCDPPDFLTAGADFNPYNKRHGRQNPDGPHLGDLPNVNFTNGLTTYNTSAPGATLGAGPGALLGANQRALVMYAGDDDQVSDPDGNSGARIACGVIVPAAGPGAVAPPKPAPVQPAASPVQPGPAPVQTPPAPAPQVPAPARPVGSPVAPPPGVPKPIASPVAAAAASPIAIVPVVPTAAPSVATARGLGTGQALIIAFVGVGLMGAGYLLRRRSQLRG